MISVDIQQVTHAEARTSDGVSWVWLITKNGTRAALHAPKRVARATAAAFNRAMTAEDGASHLVYATPHGDWLITVENGVWQGIPEGGEEDDAIMSDSLEALQWDIDGCNSDALIAAAE